MKSLPIIQLALNAYLTDFTAALFIHGNISSERFIFLKNNELYKWTLKPII